MLSPEAKKMRNEYMKEYRRKNKTRIDLHINNFWERKALKK